MSTPSSEDRFSRYLKALSSNYGAFVISAVTYAVTVPLLLQWLGPEQYGLWLILLQLTSFVVFATTWIAVPIIREAASCHVTSEVQQTHRLFHTALVYYALVGIAIILTTVTVGGMLLPFFFSLPSAVAEAKTMLLPLSIYTAGVVQLNLLISILTGFQRMHLANLLTGAPTALGAGLGILAVAGGWGLAGFALGHVIAIVMLCGIGWHLTRTINGIAFGVAHFDGRLLSRLLRTGFAYLAQNIAYLLMQSDIFLVGKMLGPATAALYGVAYKLMDYLVQLIWKIPYSLFPIMAELDAQAENKRLTHVHLISGKVTVAIAVLMALLIANYGHWGLQYWLGTDHVPPPILFPAFSTIIVLQVFVQASQMVLYSTNRLGTIAPVILIEGGLKVLLALLLLPYLGVVGVALGTIIAQLSLTVWYVPFKLCTLTGYSLRTYIAKILAPTLPASVGSMVLVEILRPLHSTAWMLVLSGAFLSAVIYVVLYLSFGLNREERLWMADSIQRVFRRHALRKAAELQ